MRIVIPIEPLFIVYTLQTAGYDAYIVGGAVRDLLMSQRDNTALKVTDYDLTTNATPEQIKELFPESFYENQFGTVSISQTHTREQADLPVLSNEENDTSSSKVIDPEVATKIHESLKDSALPTPVTKKTKEPIYEITTYRSDGSYTDHRRPETVTWGQTLQEDLERRDFTINAMALEINSQTLSSVFSGSEKFDNVELDQDSFAIIDPHKGLQDLEWRIVRTVGSATTRFQEDALRMLRAIRFTVQLGFSIDEDIFAAIQEHASLLSHISGERIRDEFFKMLLSERPKYAVELLDSTGLLKEFLPELLSAKGVEQGGHHTTDVWTHSLDALDESPSHDPVVKLATLLHDIEKPSTFNRTADGSITFYNHEIVGSRTAKKIAERLKLSKKDCDRVFILVRYHMFHYQQENTDSAIRRFMRKVGLENINDILDLREADRLGSGARKTSWRLEEMKQRMIEQLNQPFAVTDLAIDGNDLMNELNIPAGPKIGYILSTLFEEVVDNADMNTKESLLKRAAEIFAEQN